MAEAALTVNHTTFSLRVLQHAWHPLWFAVLMAIGMTLMLNAPFLSALQAKVPGQYLLQAFLLSMLLLLNLLLLVLLSVNRLQKPISIALFALGAISLYFIDNFGIVIDKSMLQNAIETDAAEAQGILSLNLYWQVITIMLFPFLASTLIKIRRLPRMQWLKYWLLCVVLIMLALSSIVVVEYAQLAPFFRNNRDVKHMALPFSTVSAAVSMGNTLLQQQFPTEFTLLGQDAVRVPYVGTNKPRLIIMVLGETARADHFQLNGYQRATNPKLSQLPVFSFQQVSSCGTATAHSVPCMFSHMGRQHYDERIAKNSSNVLDILQRSGVAVTWLDNNSGCKGVCDRVATELLFQKQQSEDCQNGQCLDSIILPAVDKQIALDLTTDRLIVVHQLGSHGPEYFKRSAEQDKHFLPECGDKQLQLCEPSSIINAYDNSIVATDHLLADLINRLQQKTDFQTALFYVSDHGESLGENGVYLHGLPYFMAPDAQTHVPLIWWMSPDYASANTLTTTCLRDKATEPYSHDNVFHSLLGMFNVQTAVYQRNKDMFQGCV
ncbi:MAG: phosphoethanolamine--lipid A transferase [Alishewanella sp.]|nr:phosphoethanolamine--lipid A transferase [Alishewanella sp.]